MIITCAICGTDKPERDALIYWDPARGIIAQKICKACYAKHILKHYPLGLVAEHIRNNPDEYGIVFENETRQLGLFEAQP